MEIKYNCSITIFTSIALLLIISLLFSLTELCRMKVNKLYMTINCDKATDSLFSLYHRKLWDKYNIFGLESFNDDVLKKEYIDFINIPIKDKNGVFYNNYYISDINKDDIDFTKDYLIEKNNFEDEILSFMKYGIVNSIIEFAGKNYDLSNNIEKEKLEKEIYDSSKVKVNSDIYNKFYKKYFNFKNDIHTLESYGKNANNYVNNYINKINSSSFSISKSEGGIESNKNILNTLYNFLNNIYDNLDNYKKKMDDFRKAVEKSKNKYLIDKEDGVLIDEEVSKFIEEEYKIYEEYVDENSEMNHLVENEKENISRTKEVIKNYLSDASRLLSEIKDVKNEIKEVRKDKDMDSDEKSDEIEDLNDILDELYEDCAELGQVLRDSRDTFKINPLNIAVSSSNNIDDTSIFDKILDLKDNGILSLVLDNDELEEIKDDNIVRKNFDIKSKNNFIDRILLSEYELNYFSYFKKDELNKNTKSGADGFEVEYLISGKDSDRKGILAVTEKLLLLREGFNIIYLYTNTEKRREARSFTNALFAAFSPIVQEMMFIILLSAWAFAESISDVSSIYNLQKVPIMHTDDTWKIQASNILSFTRDTVKNAENSNGKGLNYTDYLRILLLTTDQEIINSRMCSIIDKNINNDEEYFSMNNMIFGMDINHMFRSKHYFTNFIIYEPDNTKLNNEYKMKIKTHYDYIE